MKLLLTLFSYLSLGWIGAAAAALLACQSPRLRNIFALGCVLILGVAFFLFGTDKIIGWDSSAQHAETLAFYQTYYGLSPAFMTLTGWIQSVSAVLLIWHRRHWVVLIGAWLILCTCTAALYCHIAYDPAGPFQGLPSIMGALLAAAVLGANLGLLQSLWGRITRRAT